jgi:hypothetical protein
MLTEEDRRTLAAVMDRLIPPVDDLPGAGSMGLVADVETMAAGHGRYAAALAACLTVLSGGTSTDFLALDGDRQDAAIRAVEVAEPRAFATMLEAVYVAYYSRPEVHRRIGWRTGPLQPAGFALPPFDGAVLETVRHRRPFWRQAPE